MQISTNGLMIWGLIIMFVVSTFCGQLGVTTTDGIVIDSALESPGVWDVVTNTASAFGSFMTFRVANLGIISSIFWLIAVMEMICIYDKIRGIS